MTTSYDSLGRRIPVRDQGDQNWFRHGKPLTWTWTRWAACRGHPTGWWFPGPGQSISRKALSICERCPVRRQCLDTAVQDELLGIWGGTSENQRKTMRREHQ